MLKFLLLFYNFICYIKKEQEVAHEWKYITRRYAYHTLLSMWIQWLGKEITEG